MEETYTPISTIGELRKALEYIPKEHDDKPVTQDGSATEVIYFDGESLNFISA